MTELNMLIKNVKVVLVIAEDVLPLRKGMQFMKILKRNLSIFLSIMMLLSITAGIDFSAYADDYYFHFLPNTTSGTCGDGTEGNTVAWTFNTDNGTLSIVGKGNMADVYTTTIYESGYRPTRIINRPGYMSYYTSGGTIRWENFCNTPLINTVKMGSQITNIGDRCFYKFNEMTDATIGSSVQSIGEYAFGDGVLLTSIVIPASVKTIKRYAFTGCSSMTTVTMNAGAKEIQQYAFNNCTSLQTVQLSSKLETLGNYAFNGCTALTTISMSPALKTLGEYAFKNCSLLDGNIEFTNNTTSIGKGAFFGCNSLDSVTIDNYDCEIAEDYTTIPLNVKIIGHVGSTAQQYAEEFGNEFEAIEGETTLVIAPTCTENGYTRHICTDCGKTFNTDYTDATGHTYGSIIPKTEATCNSEGMEAHYVCSVCGQYFDSSKNEKTVEELTIPYAHEWNEGEITKAATCTEAGSKLYTCTKCSQTKTEEIPAFGHTEAEAVKENEVSASCAMQGSYDNVVYCSVCGEELSREKVMLPVVAHTPQKDNAVTPTCTKPGLTEGSHCSVCGTVLIEQQVINATGHTYTSAVTKTATCTSKGIRTYTCSTCNDTYTTELEMTAHTPVTDNAVAATCTSTGLTEGSHCSVCGYVIVAQEVINATGHAYTSVVTAPTCKEQGYTTYTCATCGESYKGDFTAVTDNHDYKAVITTPATCTKTGIKTFTCTLCGDSYKADFTAVTDNHDYIGTVTTPSTCTARGVTTFTCSVCGDKYISYISMKSHSAVVDAAVAPTCTKTGLTKGSHCRDCGAVITAQEVVNAKGHMYESVVTAPTCKEQGYTTYVCTKCGDSYKADFTAVTTNHDYKATITKPATCNEDVVKTFTCSVCGDKYTEIINKTGNHNYSSAVTTPATCTSKGVRTYTCSVCGDKYTEDIDMKSHTVVADAAVAATCTKTGLTEGSHCSVCGTVIVEQEEVPAKHHQYTSVVTAPTCRDKGYTTYTCTACGDSYRTDYTDKLTTHDYSSSVTKQPTCAAEGVKTFTCSVCGDTYTESVEKLAHTPAAPVKENEKAATCTAKGSYDSVVYCSECNAELSREENEIAIIAHTPATDEAIEPTCTTDGKTEGSHCSVCGEVLAAQETVKAAGHKEVIDAAVPATYTSEGKTEGKHCSVCGTVLIAQQTVAKLPKKNNTLSVTGKTVNVKLKKLKKKKQTIALNKAMTVSNAQGAVTFKKSKGNKKITVANNGKITVKKGLKKGKYKVIIQVTAAGNDEYNAAVKTVTVTIKVK